MSTTISDEQRAATERRINDALMSEAAQKIQELREVRDALVEALESTLQTMRNLQGMAFVGSHVPRDREPLLDEAKAADAIARAALKKARDNR